MYVDTDAPKMPPLLFNGMEWNWLFRSHLITFRYPFMIRSISVRGLCSFSVHFESVLIFRPWQSYILFGPVPSDSIVSWLPDHGFNIGSRSTSVLHMGRREVLFENRDRYIHKMERIVHGLFSVCVWSVLFKVCSIVV